MEDAFKRQAQVHKAHLSNRYFANTDTKPSGNQAAALVMGLQGPSEHRGVLEE